MVAVTNTSESRRLLIARRRKTTSKLVLCTDGKHFIDADKKANLLCYVRTDEDVMSSLLNNNGAGGNVASIADRWVHGTASSPAIGNPADIHPSKRDRHEAI